MEDIFVYGSSFSISSQKLKLTNLALSQVAKHGHVMIDQEVTKIEREHDVRIGFWRTPRKFTAMADKLAKEAARCATATSQLPDEGPSLFR